MQESSPSGTALRVALRRAAHQLFDQPLVLHDPVAVPLLGDAYAEELRRTPLQPERTFSAALRAFVVARSRYAEDMLARAVSEGVRQYVLLGAGLDTFAYRNPYPELRVFEADHPATQQWKQSLLRLAGIAMPPQLTFVPIDFEKQSLDEQLTAAGFDSSLPAFFAWLGVVMYLTPQAFRATLSLLASLPAGSGVALDYIQPRAALPYQEQLALASLAARVQQSGEPFRLFFSPGEAAAELAAFQGIEDLGTEELNQRYYSGRTDELRTMGSAARLLSAWV